VRRSRGDSNYSCELERSSSVLVAVFFHGSRQTRLRLPNLAQLLLIPVIHVRRSVAFVIFFEKSLRTYHLEWRKYAAFLVSSVINPV